MTAPALLDESRALLQGAWSDLGQARAALTDEDRARDLRSKLMAVPVTFREACAFVEKHHRHHRVPRGMLFAIACAPAADPRVVGVVVVGRPVSRMLQDGWTAEVIRLASDGTENVCSFLYGSAWRAARALGWRKLVTYTLPEEGGASLRGAGWKLIGEAGGGSWSRGSRPRVDTHPTQVKLRWEASV